MREDGEGEVKERERMARGGVIHFPPDSSRAMVVDDPTTRDGSPTTTYHGCSRRHRMSSKYSNP